jgi:hypothetical protein
MVETVAIDFDGVMHEYLTRYIDEKTISDGPVPGALRWLDSMLGHLRPVIFTTRAKSASGRTAVHRWLVRWAQEEFGGNHPLTEHRIIHYPVSIVASKPPALAYIDDRAIRFTGPEMFELLTPEYIRGLKPWNR